jgi:hypothetical protein
MLQGTELLKGGGRAPIMTAAGRRDPCPHHTRFNSTRDKQYENDGRIRTREIMLPKHTRSTYACACVVWGDPSHLWLR